MNKVKDLAELATLSLSELVDVIENENQAKLLHSFLHKTENQATNVAGNVKAAGAKKPNFKGVKRKR